MTFLDLESRLARVETLLATFGEQLRLALDYLLSDPSGSLSKTRLVGEKLLLDIYRRETGREPKVALLGEMLQDNQFTRKLERRIIARWHSLREFGNLGTHGESVTAEDARKALEDFCELVDWYALKYGLATEARASDTSGTSDSTSNRRLWFEGKWNARLFQPDFNIPEYEGTYELAVTAGNISGSSGYPDLCAEGVLKGPYSPDDTERISVVETIVKGRSNCIDGRIEFGFISTDEASVDWYDQEGSKIAFGKMVRVSGLPMQAGEASPGCCARSSLRILYFQSRPRSSGLDCLDAETLVNELKKRGHVVRRCWAVRPPLESDATGVSQDVIGPDAVRTWNPHALVFEDDFFVGDPRIPVDLLDDLEEHGSVAVIQLSPSSIWSANTNRIPDKMKKYVEFLASRELELMLADAGAREHPKCVSDSRYVETSVAELGEASCLKDVELFVGVQRVGASFAVPLKYPGRPLLTTGGTVRIKAYNSECDGGVGAAYGALYDQNGHTEAIFTANILHDHPNAHLDNHTYLANLIELLYRRRSAHLETGW